MCLIFLGSIYHCYSIDEDSIPKYMQLQQKVPFAVCYVLCMFIQVKRNFLIKLDNVNS